MGSLIFCEAKKLWHLTTSTTAWYRANFTMESDAPTNVKIIMVYVDVHILGLSRSIASKSCRHIYKRCPAVHTLPLRLGQGIARTEWMSFATVFLLHSCSLATTLRLKHYHFLTIVFGLQKAKL